MHILSFFAFAHANYILSDVLLSSGGVITDLS